MFHVIVIVNSILQLAIQIKNGKMKHVNMSVKIIASAKKDYSWNLSTYICENSKYLKSIADTLVIACDEIIPVMDIISTSVTNTIGTTVSIYSDDKKVRFKVD